MLAAGKWIVTVVPAGIALGALLGGTAGPEMKDAPAPWWRLTGNEAIVSSGDAVFVEPGPQDLDVFGGYRPDLDYEAEVWALPIPAYELAALAEEPTAPLPGELPTVGYGVAAAEQVADEAAAAAGDALVAGEAEPARAPEPLAVRKSGLASGLY